MCIALPGGNMPDEPEGIFKRMLAWTSFGFLLARFLAVGWWQWVTRHRSVGNT